MTELGDGIRDRLTALESRMGVVESIAVCAISSVGACLMVLGTVLTMFRSSSDDSSSSILTAPFDAFRSMEHPGQTDSDHVFNTLAGIGFGALLACVVIALGITVLQWGRNAGAATEWTARTVAVLMLIGMWAPVFMTLLAVSSDASDAGLAVVFFVPGVVIFSIMTFSNALRRLWRRVY